MIVKRRGRRIDSLEGEKSQRTEFEVGKLGNGAMTCQSSKCRNIKSTYGREASYSLLATVGNLCKISNFRVAQ